MKYSIITPVYNREDCIERCIRSVDNQSPQGDEANGFGIEHIVVNDGSRDNTGTLCEKWARENARLHYIDFPENRGTNAARNAAVRAASGDYIIILDSDDYFVGDALRFVDATIRSNPGYRYYMFAPDDIDYSSMRLEAGTTKELTYLDFLSGRIGGDFIHCIDAEIMKRYPFDERVRIHEGAFFLSFYKEAGKMLFTNRIVTIRERGRADSVTRETIRTRRILIERRMKAQELMLERFGDDMAAYRCSGQLVQLYVELIENYLLLGRYRQMDDLTRTYRTRWGMEPPRTRKVRCCKILGRMRLGFFYRMALYVYLHVKYKWLRRNVK